jgi:N-acyl-D-aspartate/D-glutamate deacylase
MGRATTEHDLVVRGGRVIDGTGADAFTADVAVRDGVITEVGRVEGRAARTIDADGLLVTPGFVDIHAHYDGQATWDRRMVPSSWHGVTTVVAGNCGVGFAPVRPADHDRLIELMEGVEDIPGVTLHEGLAWDWQSFPEFMDVLDGRRFDVDVAVQVPHGALRLHVMGERGAAREPATADDIAAMARLAREAVEAGALGFSTSRTLNHRTSRGDPTPTLTASADELVGIARAIGATGRGVLQLVSDFADVEAEFDLCRRMAAESGRPLSFSLLQVRDGSWRRQLDLLDAANAEGLSVTAQVAPRAVGLLLGLDCTLHPFLTNPVYREIAGLPLAERVAAMADAGFKARVLAAADDARRSDRLGGRLILSLHRMFPLGDPPDYEPDPSTSVAARAERQGRDAFDLAYDLLLADEGRAFLYLPMLNYADGNLDAAGEMLAHPHTVVGLADGGAHVGTICDASFPTTLLAHWGRDRERGRLDLPFLVHRQTQATARTVGLLDRGVVAPGHRADLNVIDFERLRARRPTMRHDLPAGGRRLVQAADGYVATLVAGQVTYEEGVEAGPLPGRLVRGPQPAPAGAPATRTTGGAP